MARYKKGETPEEEYDELWDRVSANIDESDWENIYTKDDLIALIDSKYPLRPGEPDHMIYDKMADVRRGGEIIQANITDYIIEELEEEEILTEEDKQDIYETIRDVFTERQRNTFLERVATMVEEAVDEKLAELGADKQYYIGGERRVAESLPIYQEAKEQVETQIQLAKERPMKEVYRIRRMVKSGQYLEALQRFAQKPTSFKEIAAAQYGRYAAVTGRPLSEETLQRDLTELRKKDLIEPTEVIRPGKPVVYRLTDKGQQYIARLQRLRR